MFTPRVWNKRIGYAHLPPGAIYVGRPSIWGNPFTIGPDGTRDQVIERYRVWLRRYPSLITRARRELFGHDLVCWCAPLPCHADVLLRVANGGDV